MTATAALRKSQTDTAERWERPITETAGFPVEWTEYARVYDALLGTEVYQRLMEEIADSALEGTRSPNIIDLGAGTCNLLGFLRARAEGREIRYHGAELNPAMLDIARKKHQDISLSRVDLDESREVVDFILRSIVAGRDNVIVLSNVLYSVKEPQAVLRAISESVPAGTRIVITNPMGSASVLAMIREERRLQSEKHGTVIGTLRLVRSLYSQKELITINHQIAKQSAKSNTQFMPSDVLEALVESGGTGQATNLWGVEKAACHYGDPPQNAFIVAVRTEEDPQMHGYRSEEVSRWIEGQGLETVELTPLVRANATKGQSELLLRVKIAANDAYARAHGSPDAKAAAQRVAEDSENGHSTPIVLVERESGKLIATMTAIPDSSSMRRYFFVGEEITSRGQVINVESIGEIGVYARSRETRRKGVQQVLDSDVILLSVYRRLQAEGNTHVSAVLNDQLVRNFLTPFAIEQLGIELPPYTLGRVEVKTNWEAVDRDLLRRDFYGYWGNETGSMPPAHGFPCPYVGPITEQIEICLRRIELLRGAINEQVSL